MEHRFQRALAALFRFNPALTGTGEGRSRLTAAAGARRVWGRYSRDNENGGTMTVTIEIPEGVAAAFAQSGGDLSRTALEAVAIEGYRRNVLGESQLKRMLGFDSRMDVHAFLKERGVHLNYGQEDAAHDLAEIRRPGATIQAEQRTSLRPAE